MTDETMVLAPEEPETPAIGQGEDNEQPVTLPELGDETAIEGQDGGDPAEGDDGGEPEPEEFDMIEFEGKQYQVPKALKAGFMMQADYTRKTQDIAARGRELEERATAIAQQAQASEQEMAARASLIGIDQQLQQYSQVNWDQLEQEDPMGAQQHWRRYQMLTNQRQQVVQDLAARQYQRTQEAQQDLAKRIEETQTFAKQNIKGWTPELDSQIIEFAKSKGATEPALKDAMSPLVYEMLYLARIGEQVLSRQASPKPKQQAATPLKTVAAKTNAPVRKSLSEMSMEEYAAARSRGVGN